MIVGILKEIKPQENRVCMTPSGVDMMKANGHTIYVEKNAGMGSDFDDAQYVEAGAGILDTPEKVYAIADMVMHVKEPQPSEYKLIKQGQIVFTYLHLAADKDLTLALLKTGSTGIAYETIEDRKGGLPLLAPMSEVAGRLATQQGAKYLEKTFGGRGLLLGGVTGTPSANVLVIGGGVVGIHAALVAGAKAPKLIKKEMLSTMKKGSVIVDVAIDQGGCFETSRPTTHDDPVYEVDGVIHYSVANMPGAVPLTSTIALTNATLPYALKIANNGWKAVCRDKGFAKGVNYVGDKIVCRPVADAFDLDHTSLESLL